MSRKEKYNIGDDKAAFRAWLLKELETRELRHLSVSEAAEGCSLPRIRFYNLYTDIFSLADDLADDLGAEARKYMREENAKPYEGDLRDKPYLCLKNGILRFCDAHEPFLRNVSVQATPYMFAKLLITVFNDGAAKSPADMSEEDQVFRSYEVLFADKIMSGYASGQSMETIRAAVEDLTAGLPPLFRRVMAEKNQKKQ